MSFSPFTSLTPALQASTGAGGYVLINGTGNIISWTAPADGLLHRFIIYFGVTVTSPETGGQIGFNNLLPGGGSAGGAANLDPGGRAAGSFGNSGAGIVGSGQTVTVKQNSALTAGAATAWAEIWAS